ncbi:MAG: hypothetical protein K2Y32_00410 [Candidatus Obscuribacterales bacterium]|nr:hypothetical protein [Candidatus Obscuribacterales bacterium]
MKKYITIPRPIEEQLVRAQEIRESDFLDELPNSDHVVGVAYDPKKGTARLGAGKEAQTGGVGDFIVQDAEGTLSIMKREVFLATYQPT